VRQNTVTVLIDFYSHDFGFFVFFFLRPARVAQHLLAPIRAAAMHARPARPGGGALLAGVVGLHRLYHTGPHGSRPGTCAPFPRPIGELRRDWLENPQGPGSEVGVRSRGLLGDWIWR
jgi:hypothetical protein